MLFCSYPATPFPATHQAILIIALASLLSACGSGSPVIQETQQPNENLPVRAPANPFAPPSPESAMPEAETVEPTASQAITTEENEQGSSHGGDTSTDSAPGDSQELKPTTVVACSASSDHLMERALALINEGRSIARSCGSVSFSATHPLSWNTQLMSASQNHSLDMAQHNFFSHTGSDGSSIGTRVTETGYSWRTVGENIAAGQTTAQQAVDGWFDSPGHCRNLMNPAFTEVAVSCVEDNAADFTYYWTNVLAAPQ